MSLAADPPAWMDNALCAQVDLEAWFPEVGEIGTVPAKKVCARCSVAAECLAYALEHDERHGIWGGKTPAERQKLARAKRGAA